MAKQTEVRVWSALVLVSFVILIVFTVDNGSTRTLLVAIVSNMIFLFSILYTSIKHSILKRYYLKKNKEMQSFYRKQAKNHLLSTQKRKFYKTAYEATVDIENHLKVKGKIDFDHVRNLIEKLDNQ